MKMTKGIMTAMIVGLFSAGALAAVPVESGNGLQKMGSVSASGATTLSGLHEELAQKAEAAGAGSYRIVAAGGENQMHGVAVIYK
ncbi:multiple stress resistance protein BhsA [Grimontella sp. AG753]|uniref:DUF1471 domain-containing protein n=1 Tax=Phytobacter sp. RSE-02 TaxID=3229229 RepID=UPI000D77349C|nr:multiple stress resistance protein BhsA [Grimontella sp. AG753]TCW47425.1 multiple stress resistance protein BhsA [Phytobacter diazotrophicus]